MMRCFGFVLVLFFSQPLFSKIVDKTIVSINNDILLESDVAKFQKKLKSKAFQELFGGVNSSMLNDRSAVLQLLVEEKIVDQQVKRLELQASDEEVEAQIRSIMKRNGITPDQLKERLKQLGSNFTEYRDGIRRQIERRSLIDREIKPSLEVTEEQLRHFYLRQKESASQDSLYHLAHILVSKQEKARALFEELKNNPGSFEEVAKNSSEDGSTAEKGGDLGFLALSSLSKELKAVVPKLSVGEISKPVKTSAGYHLLKVLGTRSNDFVALSKEKKDALRNQLVNSEVEKKMLLWLERKKAEAHIVRMEN